MKDCLEYRLAQSLDEISVKNGLRQLKLSHPRNDSIINLASNDYLNLSKDPTVIAAAQEATMEYGTSTSGSPVVSSYFSIHKELEEVLADWLGFKECLLWTSGFVANENILKLLPQKGDIVLADKLMHYSSLKGAIESQAKLIRFNHCDMDHLETLLKKHANNAGIFFVVTESLFSMDGDGPNLPAMASLKEKYGFIWILDEAHSVGWYGPQGRGLAAASAVTDQVDLLIVTLGKALASQGAVSLFNSPKIKSYLINHSKDFLYSTYPAPACVAAAKQAAFMIKDVLHKEQESWRSKTIFFKQLLKEVFSNIKINDSPILPIILGENDKTMTIGQILYEGGVLVGTIRPPSVPPGRSRLRLSLNKDIKPEHLAKQIRSLLKL